MPENILSRPEVKRKYVEGIDIMQISVHKNVAFINNYSTLSEERHKKISNILSNTETNRNALVPVQFSANLPRKTSTNSTASSTSDVSCRSNPNVFSYGANTNMSSEISSMFYGAVLHVNTLNVNLYTNPHSWALCCLTALVNTFLWISSVCWNKWLIFLFSLLCLGYIKLARTVDV